MENMNERLKDILSYKSMYDVIVEYDRLINENNGLKKSDYSNYNNEIYLLKKDLFDLQGLMKGKEESYRKQEQIYLDEIKKLNERNKELLETINSGSFNY